MTIEPPCGVPAHRMGRWEDVVLGIWWCPDCREEIWVREGTDDGEDLEGPGDDAHRVGSDGPAVPELRSAAADRGDAAGASSDRASSAGWRDGPAGARLWHLILDAFGRAAS